MLRSSIASSTQLLFVPARQRLSAQSLRAVRSRRGFATKRHNAELRGSNAALRSYPASNSAPFTTSAISLKPNEPNVRSPASPSSDTPVHPESAPKPPSSHPAQTSPGSSVNPPPHPPTSDASSTPPPSPPPRKPGRLRRLLVYFILTTGLAYAGGVWYSLKSDNFHDFFTEYVPYGEDAVLYLEERDFRRRFPNATRQVNRRDAPPREEGKRVTIPSKSGLSWKVSKEEEEEKGSDVTKRGKHMSAVEANKAAETPAKPSAEKENTAAVDKAREDKKSKSAATKKEVAQPAKPEPKKEEPPREPAIKSVPVATIDLLSIEGSEDPIVQNLVKTFNDMITVMSGDEEHLSSYEIPVAKARGEVLEIAKRIASAREDFEASAKKEIADAHQMFDKSAAELIRRIDEARSEEAAQYREEFESEREKLAQSYREKIKTELERAQEVAEQRLRNELVEQAIELNRKFVNDVKSLVENEREGRLSKLSELTSNVAELEGLTADWKNVIDANLRTQRLQIAVDAVRGVLEDSDLPTPFIRELAAVKELSAKDPVISAAISSISPTSYQRGIPSTAQLVDRFRRVANEVRKASLLPEDAGITSHAASLVMSKVMFQKQGASARAGAVEGDDVDSILSRTESLLVEGNLDEAAREMTGLQGWAKMLSKDWLGDVRRVLEVRQALDIIETEARLQCLQVE